MNEAQFLLSLGFMPKVRDKKMLASPAIIHAKPHLVPSAMIETKDEIDAFIDADTNVGERASPARHPRAAWL